MLEHLEELISAQSVDELWAAHVRRMALFGFDRLVYGFTRFRGPNDFGHLEDMLLLSNHPDDYIEGFIGGRMFERGPMTRWATQNAGACLWSWIAEQSRAGLLSSDEIAVVDYNLSHGVRAGFSMSFPDISARSTGAIGVCAEDGLRQRDVDAIWTENGREIFVINSLFHMRVTVMPFTNSRRPLTDRQREVLEWVGDGKTTASIATIMGLTPATVEKHLRLAREALDVDTTAQAVLKASMQKQLFLSTITNEIEPPKAKSSTSM
jgi:LuxR family transcriptional regulator